MKISSIQITVFTFVLTCFDLTSMLIDSYHRVGYGSLGARQQRPSVPKATASSTQWHEVNQFDYLAFLSKPTVTVSGIEYPVFLSDDLKLKLKSVPTFAQKLVERLYEIQQRDYSGFPIKINSFSLYLSDDAEKVYSMAFTESDW